MCIRDRHRAERFVYVEDREIGRCVRDPEGRLVKRRAIPRILVRVGRNDTIARSVAITHTPAGP